MFTYFFRAKSLSGDIIEASCVINKYRRLLLSNEAKAGFWIECDPSSLEVIEVDLRFKDWVSKIGDLSKGLQLNLDIWNSFEECDK